jgi:hypothetical protein
VSDEVKVDDDGSRPRREQVPGDDQKALAAAHAAWERRNPRIRRARRNPKPFSELGEDD